MAEWRSDPDLDLGELLWRAATGRWAATPARTVTYTAEPSTRAYEIVWETATMDGVERRAIMARYEAVRDRHIREHYHTRMEEHAREVDRRELVRREQIQAASKRASALLKLILTAEQWDSWKANRWFKVTGSAGGQYRIAAGMSGNVYRYRGGRRVEELCGGPYPVHSFDRATGRYQGTLPMEDMIIAQTLALRADEPGFRAAANIWRMQDLLGRGL